MLRTVLCNAALAVAVIYLLICGALYFGQEKLLFFPEPLPADYQFSFAPPYEEVWLTTRKKQRLHALYFPAPRPLGAVLYLHGNGGSLRSWGEEAEMLHAAGFAVLMPDYPGYGKSEGTLADESQLHETAALAYAYLRERFPEASIAIVGRSLGTGMATKLAKENSPRALILISPYASITEQALRRFPFVPPFLVKYGLPTERWIGDVRCPVTLIHGDRDEVIPFASSQKLLPRIATSGTRVTITGAGHNDIQDFPEYREAILSTLIPLSHRLR